MSYYQLIENERYQIYSLKKQDTWQNFPKDTDFNKVTDEQVQFVMDRLNSRPKASRGGRLPNELFIGLQDDLLVV
ncbi:hypothetical protein ACJJIQ_06495 [Microbulbifer sp. ANSA003]